MATVAPAGSGFHWLSPLEKTAASFTGAFDGTRSPMVRVLSCDGDAPCVVVASFTAAGSGAQKVTVDSIDEAYHVVWMVPASLPLGANRYRLQVSDAVGAEVLGTANLAIVGSKTEARSVPAPYFAVVRGSPLNIRFRIETNRVMPPVSAQLLPTGGALTVPLGGGAQMSLEVPAGALTAPVTVTFTPRAPGENGSLASVRMSPANLFFQKPARLTITLPAAVPADDARFLSVGSGDLGAPPTNYHPTTPVAGSDRSFVAELVIIGTPPSESPTTLGAFAMAAAAAEDETEISLSTADAIARIKALESAVIALLAQNDFLGAARVQNEAAALRQLGDFTSTAQLESVQTSVCSAFTRVRDTARAGLKADFRTLWSALTPLISWNAAAQMVGGTPQNCPALVDFEATITTLTTEFTQIYTAQTEPALYSASAPALEVELYRALRVRAFGGILGLDSLFGALKATVQLPLAKRLRAAAYKYCRTNGEDEQLPIGRLMVFLRDEQVDPARLLIVGVKGPIETIIPADDIGYALSDLREDAEYCATRVVPVVQDASGVRTALSPLGGTQPGAVVRQLSITAQQNGLLDFTELLGAQLCIDDAYGTETIEVRYNGRLVRTMNRIGVTGSYIRLTPDSYDVNTLAADGGVDIAAGGTFPMEFKRTGTRCGGYYADVNDTETTLFTVNLTIEAQCAVAPVTPASSTLRSGMAPLATAGCGSIALTPSITTMGGGQTRLFSATLLGVSNTAVTWSATGGSITQAGVFTAGPPGSGVITVRSVADPSLVATANVTILGGGLAISPTIAFVGFGQSRSFIVTSGVGPFQWTTDVEGGTISSSGVFLAGRTEGEFGVSVSNGAFAASAVVVVDRFHGIYDGTMSRLATLVPVTNINIVRSSLRERTYRMTTIIDGGPNPDFGPCTFDVTDLSSGAFTGRCTVSDSFEDYRVTGNFSSSGLTFRASNPFVVSGIVPVHNFVLTKR